MKILLLSLTLLLALAGCEDRKPMDTTPARPTTTTPAPLTPSPTIVERDADMDLVDAGDLPDAGPGMMMDAGPGMMDAGR